MALPDLNQYTLQMQNPSTCLVDPQLKRCTIKKNGLGNPQVRSGGFALTFCMEGGGRKWAVRCFHRESADRAKRYQAISAQLQKPELVGSGYFIEFYYQEKGIQVGSAQYPIVKMSWATGETFASFLEDNYSNAKSLENLRQSMSKLRDFLKAHGIAHGDIQPGNIMVADNGRKVQLIDYDGMFVPGLEGLSAAEIGLPNFQHPVRKIENPWGPQLDDFSFLIVDLGLRALQEDPSLWQRTNSGDDKLVFDVSDYLAPIASPVFNELKAKPKFAHDVEKIQSICLQGYTASSHPSSATNSTTSTYISYVSNYKVISPTDYATLARSVGDVCEIVGRVHSVKLGLTKYRRPYLFVCFSQWRKGCPSFRIVLWSEVLNKMFGADGIDESAIAGAFVGKHLTVSSLVSVYGVETYQVTPESPSAIRIISEEEAAFRLGKTRKTICQPGVTCTPAQSLPKMSAAGRNSERVSRLLGSTVSSNSKSRKSHAPRLSVGSVRPVSSKPKGSSVSSRNAGVIGQLKKSGDYSLVKNPTKNGSSGAANPVGSTPSTQSESSGIGYIIWIVLGLIILFAKCCSH